MKYVILDVNGDFLAHYWGDKPDFDAAADCVACAMGLEDGPALLELAPEIVLRVTLLQ